MNPRALLQEERRSGGLSAVDDDHSVLSLFQKKKKVFLAFTPSVAKMLVVTRILTRKTTALFCFNHTVQIFRFFSIHW